MTHEFSSSTVRTEKIGTIRPNKTIPVFRVTLTYKNLLVKPRIFSRFLEKYIILCSLKGKMPFKMHKLYSFSTKKKRMKKICGGFWKKKI